MSDDRLGVVLEDIQDKLEGLADIVSVLAQDMQTVKATTQAIPQMVDEIKAIKLVVRDQEGQLQNHEQRINKLEMPARA